MTLTPMFELANLTLRNHPCLWQAILDKRSELFWRIKPPEPAPYVVPTFRVSPERSEGSARAGPAPAGPALR
jgi:hypothetical protein